MPDSRPAQPNKSLMDGIDLLLALVSAGEPVGVRDLARRIGMETTRVQRLLGTLAYQGMAVRTAERKYAPGPGIHVLSTMSLAASGLLSRALPQLQALAGLAPVVALGVLWRDEMCYLYHGGGGESETAHAIGRMTHFPAARSALGVALLAAQDAAYIERHIAGRLDPAGLTLLQQRIDEARARGYAAVPQENGKMLSIAVPVGSPPYAALGCSGPIGAAAIPSLVERLHHSAAKIDQEAAHHGVDRGPDPKVTNRGGSW